MLGNSQNSSLYSLAYGLDVIILVCHLTLFNISANWSPDRMNPTGYFGFYLAKYVSSEVIWFLTLYNTICRRCDKII